jgi:hypothetical protein
VGYSWTKLKIPRLYGLDLKTNVIDVADGKSLGLENCFQNGIGVMSKRPGNSIIFASDAAGETSIDEIGQCTIEGVKYYFRFLDGKFQYSTTLTGATTELAPSPAISTDNAIWWDVLQDKLYFVDGENVLRYFDGAAIKDSVVYERPTVAPTGSGGTGFNYGYTVDNQLGESPIVSTPLIDDASGATITIAEDTGPQTLVVGDRIRIYSRPTSTLAQWRNVTPTSGTTLQGTYGQDAAGGYLEITSTNATYAIVTVALSDAQPILYSDLGVALNGSAPTGLQGITVHYGRLVGWLNSSVYVSKVTNANSFPPNSAVREAWTYSFFNNDGEVITVCRSYQESLYVFKDTKVAAFGGIGPDDTGNNAFSFRRLETNGIGCVAGKSVQVVGDEESKNYLVWLSREGFYATTGDRPVRVGEDIESQVFSQSLSNLRLSVSVYHKRQGFYYCFVGTATSKTGWVLDLRKDGEETVGWFKFTGLNPTCIAWDEDKYLFGTAEGFCARERNAGTSVDFSDVRLEFIEPSDVDTAADSLTVVDTYETGDQVVIRSTGTVPGGLTANTTYYAIAVAANEIQLASSLSNALAGTFIALSSQGTGVHSLVGKEAIAAFYTTNWIKFKDAATVKKLSKPMVLLNAAATTVNITMQMAVDWFDSFFDPHTIEVTSNDLWGDSPWGSFVWGAGAFAAPKNVSIARRKCRSVRYKFSNSVLEQDFNLKGIEQEFAYIRNRGELVS